MNSNFNILRTRGEPISRTYAAVAVRGLAVASHATDAAQSIAAGPAGFLGFLVQEVKAAGPGLREAVHNVGNDDTGIRNAVKAGGAVTIQDADMVEIEGSDYLDAADPGAIDALTAIETELTFEAGKFSEAALGNRVYFVVTANSAVASSTLAAKNGGIRIIAKRVGDYVKA
jgi:hypothetical protein